MTQPDMGQRGGSVSILLLNPNSSTSMTRGMGAAAGRITALMPSVTVDTYTAPSAAPASIDDDADMRASADAVLGDGALAERLRTGRYDAVLVACFSVHRLVGELARTLDVPVTGIFEASILSALSSLVPAAVRTSGSGQWGIVTTGKFWEQHLADGVSDFLGVDRAAAGAPRSLTFAGVASTGLDAGDFHSVAPAHVAAKLRAATEALLRSGNVTCVVMGCGGMAGLQDMVRSVAADVYGRDRADGVHVVDGVQAGILQLQQTVLGRRACR